MSLNNHPNRAAITAEELRTSYVSVRRRFKLGAVAFDPSPSARVQLKPFYVVHWDHKSVSLTLHHENQATVRVQRGLDEWIPAWSGMADFLDSWEREYNGSPEMGSRAHHRKQGLKEAQRVMIEDGRDAQDLLDAVAGDEVPRDVRERVVNLLSGA